MVVAGIIAEYNPFHNGHLHQIERVKEKLNPDYIIVALGNNFSQRGEPSILDKFDKTTIALEMGVDLVLEIPQMFSCASAEYFAKAGVNVLNNTGIVTHLCFGAETDDGELIIEIAKLLTNEPAKYKKLLKEELSKGVNFPVARCNALTNFFDGDPAIKEILSGSNNILAIEYIKELIRLKSTITPYLIQRKGPGFNSSEIIDNISSATNIRNLIFEGKDVSSFVPEITNNFIKGQDRILDIDNYFPIFHYNLITQSDEDLREINEVREGIEKTLFKKSKDNILISEIIEASKSKRFTYTGISRIITNIILGITKKDFEEGIPMLKEYIRILGFREKSEKLVSCIYNSNKKMTVIMNVNKFLRESKNKKLKAFIEKEMRYNNIYHINLDNKVNSDLTQKMIVLK
ncbi:MAG: nucleotidyltransferase family protein [Clostridia bacterium]|nr:nucleotidyltransferase family protein [Clostridia bacterium]